MFTRTPSYRHHKPSGQAVVTLAGHDSYLGKHGTPESRAEYDRLIAEWLANGRRSPRGPALEGLSLNELALTYFHHVEQRYRRSDGTQTNEVGEYRMSLRPLKHLYGPTPARDFGPLALKAVRQRMIDGYDHPRYGPQERLSRGVINRRIGRIKHMFRWAVENEMVPPSILQGLQAVRGLQRGRTAARERPPVGPVPLVVVEATLPFLNRDVAAMVRVQLLAGARRDEVCAMRACDLDTSGKVWLYRPESHKTAHLGRGRVIALGPNAQELIKPFLTLDTQAYLFSPARALEEIRAAKRQARKTKVQPSQQNRRKRRPKRVPGVSYCVSAYDHAIQEACKKADAHACAKAQKEHPGIDIEAVLVPHWHPHQLRHTRAAELRRRYGLDVAQAIIGHASMDATMIYAEADQAMALKVMQEIG
jgi:integrase